MDIRAKKPLWGFGPIGWLAIAVLLTLLTALLRGWDPVFAASSLLWRLGNNNMQGWAHYYLHFWVGPHFAVFNPGVGPIGALYLTVILFVFPYRINRIAPLLIVAGLLIECFTLPYHRPIALMLATSSTLISVTSKCLALALISTGLTIIFRRKWIPALVFLPYLAGWLYEYLINPGNVVSSWYFTYWNALLVTNHLVISLPLLTLAIRARLRPVSGIPCPTCGYDLTGLPPAAPCPECGRTLTTSA